jgi:hypothetical protein
MYMSDHNGVAPSADELEKYLPAIPTGSEAKTNLAAMQGQPEGSTYEITKSGSVTTLISKLDGEEIAKFETKL